MLSFKKSSGSIDTDLSRYNPFKKEITQEADIEKNEKGLLKNNAEKLNKIEIQTVENIEEALSEILTIVSYHRNNLSTADREKISQALKNIVAKENTFKKGIQNIKDILKRIGSADLHQLQKQKERMVKTDGEEKQVLETEVRGEEEKLKIEESIMELEKRIDHHIEQFNKLANLSVQYIGGSPYPYDAAPYLKEAMATLKELVIIIKDINGLEEKLVEMTNIEKKLMQKEKHAE